MNLKAIINDPNCPPPTRQDMISLRRHLQQRFSLYSTPAARILCAELCGRTKETWTKWERGDSTPLPAFWVLTCIRADQLLNGARDGNAYYEAMKPRLRALSKDAHAARLSERGRKGALATNKAPIFSQETVDYAGL